MLFKTFIYRQNLKDLWLSSFFLFVFNQHQRKRNQLDTKIKAVL